MSHGKAKAVLAFDVETTGSIAYRTKDGKKTWMVAAGFQLVAGGMSVDRLKVVFEMPEWGVFEPDCKKEFWDKPAQKKQLDEYLIEGNPAAENMLQVHNFIRNAEKEYDVIIACDSPFDADWLQMYLREYGPPECCGIEKTAGGAYTGFPYVTDDQYRGALKTTSTWGLEQKLAEKMPEFKRFKSADHDALEIAMNYWRFLKEQKLI